MEFSVSIPLEQLQGRLKSLRPAQSSEPLNVEVYLHERTMLKTTPADAASLRNGLLNAGVSRITIHGPFMSLMPGSPDRAVRQHTLDSFMRAFDYVAAFNAEQIVLHAGANDPDLSCTHAEWLHNSLPTWNKVADMAGDMRCKVAIENTYEPDYRSLERLMLELGRKHMGICLDMGHLNLPDRLEMEEWFKKLGTYIIELHLHDNFGKEDDHLALGSATIDFKQVMALAKKYTKNPVYTLECRTVESVTESLNHIMAQ